MATRSTTDCSEPLGWRSLNPDRSQRRAPRRRRLRRPAGRRELVGKRGAEGLASRPTPIDHVARRRKWRELLRICWLERLSRSASGMSSVSSAIRSTRSPTRYDAAASIGSASATRRGRRWPPLVRRNSPGVSLSAPVRPVLAARIWLPASMKPRATTRLSWRCRATCRGSSAASTTSNRPSLTSCFATCRSIRKPSPRRRRRRASCIRRSLPPTPAAASLT